MPAFSSAPLRLSGLLALALAACATPIDMPPSAVVTRVASLQTPTPTLAPTSTPTPKPTSTATFTPSPTATASPTRAPEPIVHFMAVGDVMLGRSVGERIESAFGGVASTLLSADLVAANLECAISDLGKAEPKAYVFRAPLTAPEVLAQSGVDVVTLANNHAGDFGFDALLDTQARLSAAGILAVGAGRNAAEAHTPVVVERNGVRIAFLAYVDVLPETRSGFDTRVWIAGADTSGVAWAYPAEIVNDVTQAKTQADVVIVLLHFGLEGRAEVALAQRTAARAAIEAGAALVIGAHPHLLQSVERHKNGLIAYSLGNFVFDQFTPPQTYAAIFAATLTPQGVQEYNWIPVVIEDGLPRLATADEAQKILPMVAEAKLP